MIPAQGGPPDAGKVTLYLVRHGQTRAAVTNVLDTRPPGLPLTPEGVRQAEDLADVLAGTPFVAVYASLALRAQQTASALAIRHGLEVQVLPGLHEVQLGEWEGRDDAETLEKYVSIFSGWLAGDIDLRIPGGESGRDVLERFRQDLRVILDNNNSGRIVVVGHGAAIRLMSLNLAANLTSEIVGSQFLPYCGLVVLETVAKSSGTWRCVEWIGQPLSQQ